jgi:DDE superfamily endonuclease
VSALRGGLIGPGDRKSVQPMAERLAPGDYDQLHHFIAAGVWDALPLETELLVQADRLVGGSDAVLVIDDTAMPKKGTHSVGVAAQYPSALGKTANNQLRFLTCYCLNRRVSSSVMNSRLFKSVRPKFRVIISVQFSRSKRPNERGSGRSSGIGRASASRRRASHWQDRSLVVLGPAYYLFSAGPLSFPDSGPIHLPVFMQLAFPRSQFFGFLVSGLLRQLW